MSMCQNETRGANSAKGPNLCATIRKLVLLHIPEPHRVIAALYILGPEI